jgi:hypothetical protein
MSAKRELYFEIKHSDFSFKVYKRILKKSTKYDIVVKSGTIADRLKIVANTLLDLREICMALYIEYIPNAKGYAGNDLTEYRKTWNENLKIIYEHTSNEQMTAQKEESIARVSKLEEDSHFILIETPLQHLKGKMVGATYIYIEERDTFNERWDEFMRRHHLVIKVGRKIETGRSTTYESHNECLQISRSMQEYLFDRLISKVGIQYDSYISLKSTPFETSSMCLFKKAFYLLTKYQLEWRQDHKRNVIVNHYGVMEENKGKWKTQYKSHLGSKLTKNYYFKKMVEEYISGYLKIDKVNETTNSEDDPRTSIFVC